METAQYIYSVKLQGHIPTLLITLYTRSHSYPTNNPVSSVLLQCSTDVGTLFHHHSYFISPCFTSVVTLFPYLADFDGRRCSREPWQAGFEGAHFTELPSSTSVDSSDPELVGSAR